jgi:3-carboxy-cis,cis-muconate cycloisomerase
MASTVFDSGIFRDMFGTPAMRAVFSDEALTGRYVETEVALAKAQGKTGVIPAEAAAVIAAKATNRGLDLERLKRESDIVGYPILPIVRQIAEQCNVGGGDAGKFVHWGATTQDIMDTATVLQVRAALDLVTADLDGVRAALVALTRKHRDTPMAGRTHLQQALPITFGHKTAIWLSMLDRHAERLDQLRPRVEQVQFGGAAGTLASLGTKGLEVRKAMAAELKLGDPVITWHVARDGLAETVQLLGLITGSLGKIAQDVMLMMATELGEAAEPFVESRGASSTMPQKRNPISCELILAAARIVRQSCGLMLDAMVTDFERATGPWHLEWAAIPEAFLATSSALHQARFMLSGLIVEPARMRKNLDMTSGLIVAEAVMMGLAPHMGRNEAHDVVYEACRAALTDGAALLAHLEADPRVTRYLAGAALAALVEPGNYLGVAGAMIDQVLARHAKPE